MRIEGVPPGRLALVSLAAGFFGMLALVAAVVVVLRALGAH